MLTMRDQGGGVILWRTGRVLELMLCLTYSCIVTSLSFVDGKRPTNNTGTNKFYEELYASTNMKNEKLNKMTKLNDPDYYSTSSSEDYVVVKNNLPDSNVSPEPNKRFSLKNVRASISGMVSGGSGTPISGTSGSSVSNTIQSIGNVFTSKDGLFGDDEAKNGNTASSGPLKFMSNTNANPHTDMWLSMQLYRKQLVAHTESLQNLLEYSFKHMNMMQSFNTQASNVFVASLKLLTFEQCRIWSEAADILQDTCSEVMDADVTLTTGFSVVSPTANKIRSNSSQVLASPSDNSDTSEDDGIVLTIPEKHRQSHAPSKGSDILLSKRPLNAKVVDNWLQNSLSVGYMPNSEAVVLHGIMPMGQSSAFYGCVDPEEAEKLWRQRHVTVTIDGYIHICKMTASGTPVLPPVISYDTSVSVYVDCSRMCVVSIV